MKFISFDIETTGLNAYNKDARITCICAKDSEGYTMKGYLKHNDVDNYDNGLIEDREFTLIKKLIEFIDNRKGYYLLSKNGIDFDIPFILTRATILEFEHSKYTPKLMRLILRRKHIDIQLWTKRRISLQTMSELFGIPGKTLPSALGAIQLWKDHRYQKLMNYCLNDVELTIKMFNLRNKLIRYNN
jgi:DNA polymerase elongation subunit (family B)